MRTHTYVSLYTANAYSAEREMSTSACTRSMAGWLYSSLVHGLLGWVVKLALPQSTTAVPSRHFHSDESTRSTTIRSHGTRLRIQLGLGF